MFYYAPNALRFSSTETQKPTPDTKKTRNSSIFNKNKNYKSTYGGGRVKFKNNFS